MTAAQLAAVWGSKKYINDAIMKDLNTALGSAEINTPQRLQHFMAQVVFSFLIHYNTHSAPMNLAVDTTKKR